MFAGKTMPVAADQLTDVRKAISETQTDFASRFSCSRATVARWERSGAKFKYQSRRWHVWQRAIVLAIKQIETRGYDYEQAEQLRQLRIL